MPSKSFKKKSMDEPPPDNAATSGGAADDAATAHALQNIYLSNVLVYPSQHLDNGDKQADSTDENNNKKTENKQEEPRNEKWSCTGSTEVDILVLRPQNSKKESIVAVAPYCSPGITTRDVSTPSLGKDRTSTIHLGILEIVFQSSVTEDLDDDHDEEASEDVTNGKKNTHSPLSSRGKTAVASDEAENRNENSNKRKTQNKEKGSSSTSLSDTPKKVYLAGSNILKQMQINAKLLYQSTQDDFPNRTYQASQRIYLEFGKTLDRMNAMWKKLVDDDDDDQGSNFPRRR